MGTLPEWPTPTFHRRLFRIPHRDNAVCVPRSTCRTTIGQGRYGYPPNPRHALSLGAHRCLDQNAAERRIADNSEKEIPNVSHAEISAQPKGTQA